MTSELPAGVKLRLYLVVLLMPGGDLALAANIGDVPDWAGRMVRIINSAELLCKALATEFHNSPGSAFRELAAAAEELLKKAQAVQAQSWANANDKGDPS